MGRPASREIFRMELTEAPIVQTRRLRSKSELEADVRELCRVLPLPGGASDVIESVALRFGGERSHGRTVPRRVHEDQCGEKPDDERRRLRAGHRSTSRKWRPGFLLFDLSKHAPEHAPRLRD